MGSGIIVVGSKGFIGRHLTDYFKPAIYTHYKNAPHLLDLKSPTLDSLPITNQTHLIITAGCANINFCTQNPQESYTINVRGTLELVKQSVERGIIPVIFSTDYVFDGKTGYYTELSPTNPINEYGYQKAELEQKANEMTNGKHLTLRLSKTYSLNKDDGTLLSEIASLLKQGKPVYAARDQVFCPLAIHDFIFGLERLIERKSLGLFNMGGIEKISRHQLAVNFATTLQYSPSNIIPISLNDLNPSLSRPLNTALCSDKLYKHIEYTPNTLSQSFKTFAAK